MLLISLLTLFFALTHSSPAFADIFVNNMNPAQGITIRGAVSYNVFGYSVRPIGDFNDDGYDDVAIGAYGMNSLAGAVYVIFGSKNGLSDFTVSSTLLSGQGMVINGINPNDRLGFSVSSAGDVNDDGTDDIIIGADQAQGTKGAAYVIYGRKNPPAVINLAQGLSINQGFFINGASLSNSLGADVSWAGDINKDGIDDIIVGAYGVSGAKGAAYVIFGKQGTRNDINIASGLSSSEGFAILGANILDGVGSRVSGAGDFDGDGVDDIIITAYGANAFTGAAYLIYGKDGSSTGNTFSTIDLTGGLPLSQGFKITGAPAGGQFGAALGHVGDFNGDGRSDVIIGAPRENSYEGKAYVILGGPRSQLSNIDLILSLNYRNLRPILYLGSAAGEGLSNTIDPSRCISIKRTVSADNLGYSVNGAGDINGDGIDDIIVGAPGADISAGRAFVIFGSQNFGAEINLDNGLTPQEGFTIIGDLSGDLLGFSLSQAGDMNGDGMVDLIVGAAGVDTSTGAAYIFFGELVCPEKCLTCQTKELCLTCEAGYGLFNGKCVMCPASTELTNGVCVSETFPLRNYSNKILAKNGLTKPTQISKGMFDSGSTASRIFTMGRSLSVGLGLIAKIIQNVRFLNISYPAEALNAFQNYGTDLFELPIPEILYETPETKDLPSQYSRYDISPTFLENYWQTIMTILISLLFFLAIKLLQYLTKSQRKESLLQVALRNVGQTAANFLIIQIYSNLDDVIFYFLLDTSSTKMSSASAGFSMSAAGFFLLLGLALVYIHCWVLGKYQQAKKEDQLEQFREKFKVVGTLYDDFKDDSTVKQSFFGILILRCVFLVLVIMLLQPPWIQASLLMTGNLIFLGYLIYQRPFKSLFDEISQYFSELTVFAAYLSVLVLAVLDYKEDFTSSVRNGFGKCIVLAGIVLCLGGFIIQMIQIIGVLIEISKFVRNYYRKKPRVLRASDLDLNKNNQKKSEICESNQSIMMFRNNSLSHIELSGALHKNLTMAPQDSLEKSGNEPEISFINPADNAEILDLKSGNTLKSKNLTMSRGVLETVRVKVSPNLLRDSQENQQNITVEEEIPSAQNETSRRPKKFKRKPKPVDMTDVDGM